MASNIETRQRVFETKLDQAYIDILSMSKNAGFVYVAINDSYYLKSKIGCTRNPRTRIHSFNTYCPNKGFKLVAYKLVENMFEYEKQVHEVLDEFRLKGEWFDIAWSLSTAVIHDINKSSVIIDRYKNKSSWIKENPTNFHVKNITNRTTHTTKNMCVV
jgi:hypothetical protein